MSKVKKGKSKRSFTAWEQGNRESLRVQVRGMVVCTKVCNGNAESCAMNSVQFHPSSWVSSCSSSKYFQISF